jgi:hypothetical protein
MSSRGSDWTGCTAAVFSVLLATGPGSAAEVRLGGVRLEVPESWSERTAPAPSAPGQAERLWVLGPVAAPVASLIVSATPSPTEVSFGRLAAARLEVERCGREQSGGARLEVHAIGIKGWRGISAYEIAATSRAASGPVRHLQYLLEGSGAVAVTLSAPADRFESLRPELERIAGSIAVEDRPSAWAAAPRWLCGSVLAALLGLGALPSLAGRGLRRHLAASIRALAPACPGTTSISRSSTALALAGSPLERWRRARFR